MGIILKHSIKNLSSKKGRTFILIVCVAITAFVAMLAFDMVSSVETLMTAYFTQSLGDVDLMIDTQKADAFEGCTDYEMVRFAVAPQIVYDRDEEMYSYSFRKPLTIVAFDNYENAYTFGQINDRLELDDESVAISSDYAEERSINVGDTISLYCADGNTIERTVVQITGLTQFALFNSDVIFTSPETIRIINAAASVSYYTNIISLNDYSKAEEFKAQVLSNDPTAEITDLKAEMSDMDMSNLYNTFYLIFLFAFLLVIFVTVSFSEKIVSERMPVIGTFRSLGLTAKATSLILIIENVLYGLIGSGIGLILYRVVRIPFFKTFMRFDTDNGTSLNIETMVGDTPLYIYAIVLVGAILVETVAPIFALSKAVRMSIRDIIFANKDTAFKYTWGRAYVGIICVIVAVVSSFLNRSFWGLCVSIIAIIIAISSLMPFVIKGVSMLGEKYLKTSKTPILKLAVKEISNNRTLVNTSVLCVSAIILSTCLYTLAYNQRKVLLTVPYDCDILVDALDHNESYFYSFINDIDGVEEVEFIRGYETNVSIEGITEEEFEISPWENLTMYTNLSDINETLNSNEIILTEGFARSNNLHIGDTIRITLNAGSFFPREGEYVIKNLVDSGVYSSKQLYINSDKYEDMYGDNPLMIAIRCEEGRAEEIARLIDKYIVSDNTEVRTYDELVAKYNESASGLAGVLSAIIVLGIGLTIIGVSGNQSIGFENRRREMAVLYSTAMSKKGLIKLMCLENAISIGLSALTAYIISPILVKNFSTVLELVSDGDIVAIKYDFVQVGIYIVLAFLAVMLTNLIPIKRIKNMKCSMELKYE